MKWFSGVLECFSGVGEWSSGEVEGSSGELEWSSGEVEWFSEAQNLGRFAPNLVGGFIAFCMKKTLCRASI